MRNTLLFATILIGLSQANSQTSHDIYVSDKVLVQRAIIGGPSERMIGVGHPGGFNYAFDAVHCAVSYAWFGGFIDLRGETTGRGGRFCQILGVKRPVSTEPIPFRAGEDDRLPETIRFRGYRRQSKSGDPTFLYTINQTEVEQQVSNPETDLIGIEFHFPKGANEPLFFLLDSNSHREVSLSENLEWSSPGIISIPKGTENGLISIRLKKTNKTFTRKQPELSGATIFQNFCVACHSTDGSKLIGPSFKGFWGKEQTVIRNGKTEIVTVDRDYALESILHPQAAIVKGYEQVPMANFSSVLSQKQIEKLVDHLKTLH